MQKDLVVREHELLIDEMQRENRSLQAALDSLKRQSAEQVR